MLPCGSPHEVADRQRVEATSAARRRPAPPRGRPSIYPHAIPWYVSATSKRRADGGAARGGRADDTQPSASYGPAVGAGRVCCVNIRPMYSTMLGSRLSDAPCNLTLQRKLLPFTLSSLHRITGQHRRRTVHATSENHAIQGQLCGHYYSLHSALQSAALSAQPLPRCLHDWPL
jgi:hypothetical protein